VRKPLFLTAPLNIRIPYQVTTSDVLGTYLLIGTDKGLLACDLTSTASPHGRLRMVIKDVAFRQIRILEEYGQIIALSGKNSHLRSYKLASIRALVEWTFQADILTTSDPADTSSSAKEQGKANGYSSPVSVRPPATDKTLKTGPTLARGITKQEGAKLSAEDKDLYALRNEHQMEEASEAETVLDWMNAYYKIPNTKSSLSFSITKTARTTYLGALNRDGVTVFEWADDPYMKFMELKPFWTPEKPLDYQICHDGDTITGVWLGYKQEANFVRFEDSQVVEIAANPDLMDPAAKGSWTGMMAIPRVATKSSTTNPATAARLAAERVMTIARNPALVASARTSNPDLSQSGGGGQGDVKPPMYLATVGVLSRFVELDGQPTGPYAKMIYKWSSPPDSISIIRAPEKENGILIGYCRESIDVLDIQSGIMLQSVRHMNIVRCLTDVKRGRIFLGSYKSYPQRFSNMYFWMENKDELERHFKATQTSK